MTCVISFVRSFAIGNNSMSNSYDMGKPVFLNDDECYTLCTKSYESLDVHIDLRSNVMAVVFPVASLVRNSFQ